jgi:hypothetical protein
LGPREPVLTARFPGDWGGSFRLQLSYYALHAARLSTCRRRAAHMSPSPAPPLPRSPPPAPRPPSQIGRERASELGKRREGTRRAQKAVGQGARAAESVPRPVRVAGAARGAGRLGVCKRCARLRGPVWS